MATNDVNIGVGRVSGMFYYAPASDELTMPTFPSDTLAEAFVEGGFISEDGPTLTPFGSVDVIRDWSRTARRQVMTEKGTVQVSLISTTKDSLTAIFGDRVTETAATTTHGKLLNVDMSQGPTSNHYAFVFIGKDGDDEFMISSADCTVTEVGDVAFNPTGAINWAPTIEGDWKFVKDDGQKTGQ